MRKVYSNFTNGELSPANTVYRKQFFDITTLKLTYNMCKKGKRNVQGVPQSQTAALPRPQEEEETDKSKQAQTEQTYKKH